MTYKEKIAWLSQYRAAVNRERMLESELEMLRSDAERVTACMGGMPGAGPDVNRLPRAVERIDETRKKLEQEIEDCVDRRFEVMRVVAAVAAPDVQEVLRRRYILGQTYPEIADAVGPGTAPGLPDPPRRGAGPGPGTGLQNCRNQDFLNRRKFSRKLIVIHNLK